MTATRRSRLLAASVAFAAALSGIAALSLQGQTPPSAQAPVAPAPPTEVSIVLTQETGRRIPLAIPAAAGTLPGELQAQVAEPFSKALQGDLASLPAFIVADPALHPKGFRPPCLLYTSDAADE